MKYTSPIYSKETVEATDVICGSPYSLRRFKVMKTDPVTNEPVYENVTEIFVDSSNL